MIQLFSASKRAAFTITIAGLIAACGLTRGAQKNASISSSTVPKNIPLRALTGRVSGTSRGIQGLLISSVDNARFSPLSNSFFVATTGTIQHLGSITAGSNVPSHFRALLDSGRVTACTQNSTSENTLTSSTTFNIQCERNTLLVELATENINSQTHDYERTKKSLLNGAVFHLDSANGRAEIHLIQDTLTVLRTESSTQFTFDNAHNLLSKAASSISLRSHANECPNNGCTTARENAELTLTSDALTLKIVASETGETTTFEKQIRNKMSVSTYNVENYWDDDPNNSNPYNDFSSLYSNWYIENFPQKKAERIKSALIAAGLPDIVGLQEIESANNKSRSLEILKPVLTELGYNYYALGLQGEDNPTAVTTAVISKHPITDNTHIEFVYSSSSLPDEQKNDFVGSSRDPQQVTITLPEGQSFALINSHWKSKRDKSPFGDDMRQTVAALIKQHSDSLFFDNGAPVPVVIVGDFNADYREAPVQNGLQLANTIASARVQEKPKQLVPLWLTLGPTQQGSYPHDSHLQALDNIVVTASFFQNQSLTLAEPLWVAGRDGQSARTLANADGQPLRSQMVKYKSSQGDIHARHFDLGYSDHFPLVAVFNRQKQTNVTAFSREIELQSAQSLPYVLIDGSQCGVSETISLTADALGTALYGQCVSLNGIELPLGKTGLYNIYIQPTGSTLTEKPSKIIITADRAYGTNKSWLRGTLQNSEGRTLTKLKGRVGIVDGQKAIFIHSPADDIEIK